MDLMQAIRERHSVRSYLDKRIDAETRTALLDEIEKCNIESGLNIQLVCDEPKAFGSILAHYGLFRNVSNYIALVGKKDHGLEEKIGYYGERIVLKAQQQGLNTCWVAATYKKGQAVCEILPDEKLVCVIALGYGANQGKPHRGKPLKKLYKCEGEIPDWFKNGVEAAALAPTAVNQQKFCFTLLTDGCVKAEKTGGVIAEIDLGIVKYHFEIGAGKENFKWE